MASTRSIHETSVGAGLAALAIPQDDAGRGIPTRRLGRTEEQVSVLCLGGAHLGRAAQDDGEKTATKLAHAAVDNGVFFWDNAWMYHDGYAENSWARRSKAVATKCS